MRVGIFSPYATVAPHFEAEMELAQLHLDAGDDVHYVGCDGQLTNCDFNIDRDPQRCKSCLGRREHGLDAVAGKCHVSMFEAGHGFDVPELLTLEQLTNFHVAGFDVGYAALSSLVSVCRDPEPDLEKHGELLRRFINSALATFAQTLALLDRRPLDRVYVFNGRFAAMRAVFRACQARGVDCFLHERGKDKDHYELFENHLPHDLVGVEGVIRKLWADADPVQRERIGASWYEDRFNRVETAWHSFTKDQQYGRLPAGFSSDRRNVSIFCSSDDEFVAIGDAWKNDLYPNQVQAIAAIAGSMREAAPETRLFLRVHPNLAKVDNARKRQMMALDFPNLEIIAADAQVDTYALLKASDTVASFGSSVGMEAVFWERPSVLLGPCLYQNLGGPLRSRSHRQTVELLCDELEPADKTGALMYGHWFQARGYPYRYFQATNFYEGKFKGEVLHDREAAGTKKRSWLKRLVSTGR